MVIDISLLMVLLILLSLQTSSMGPMLMDMDEAVGVYTWDLENTAMFSPMFIDALAYQIAHQIAFPLTGKSNIADVMLQKFNEFLYWANASDGNERVEKGPRDAPWIRGRY